MSFKKKFKPEESTPYEWGEKKKKSPTTKGNWWGDMKEEGGVAL